MVHAQGLQSVSKTKEPSALGAPSWRTRTDWQSGDESSANRKRVLGSDHEQFVPFLEPKHTLNSGMQLEAVCTGVIRDILTFKRWRQGLGHQRFEHMTTEVQVSIDRARG